MKTKIISTLILIILVTLSLTTCTLAAGENTVTLTASAQTVQVGDTVTITMKLSEGILTGHWNIIYPKEILQYDLEQDAGECIINPAQKGKLDIIHLSQKPVYDSEGNVIGLKNVDTFKLDFKVISTGEAEVSTVIDHLNVDNDKPLEFTNKSIKITAKEKTENPPPIQNETVAVTSVALDKTTASIKVGETTKLTATVLPTDATDKSVTWSSSDTSVATVSNGTVTGIKAGTTTITAKAGDKTATCTVTVTAKTENPPSQTIEVTNITLNKTTANVSVRKTIQLIATVTPENATNKTVTWTSSDPVVATVSADGIVTGESVGTAIITAKAGNKTATCTITVDPSLSANIEVTGIKLNKESISINVNEKAKLIATVSPEDATDKKVTWKSSDTNIVTVSDGIITGIKEGKAVITATAGTKSASCTVTVTKSSSNNTVSVPDKDTTTSKVPIPQTGETYLVIGSIFAVITIAVISILKYRRYRDI